MNGLQANRIVNVMLVIMIIVMLAAVAGLGITIRVNNELQQQQKDFHVESVANLSIIQQNQVAQTTAFKDYVACLLNLKPGPNLKVQEQTCFDNAPQVK